MKRAIVVPFIVAASLSLASCASFTNPRGDTPAETASVKYCGSSPRDVVRDFFEAMKTALMEFNLAPLRAMLPDGKTLYEVFGHDDEKLGRKVVDEIIAHPEIAGGSKGCVCSLLAVERTDDPNERIVWAKRIVTTVDGDINFHRRSFRVRFQPVGNCPLGITPIEPRWERMPG